MDRVARKLAATDESQEICECKEVTGKPVEKATRKPDASRTSEDSGTSAVVPHMEKVYSIVRKTYDRSPRDNLDDLDVNTAVWCIYS